MPKTVRTAGGMIHVNPGRHLGRARRYKRKRRLQPSELVAAPEFWNPCNICGGLFVFAKVEDSEYMGKHMCAWCKSRDGKKQIQYMVLVEKLADLECIRDLKGLPAGKGKCKCLSCNARLLVQRDSSARTDASS